MKKTAGLLIGTVALSGALLYSIMPECASDEKKAPFMGKNIAHRGLHTPDRSVPENTLAAFEAAVSAGYGIELDVHLTSDDKLVVFHDDDLERLTGVPDTLEEHSYEELSKLRIAGTDQKIPLFSEVLELVAGRAPMIIELKDGHDNTRLSYEVHELLKDYKGDYCIESFNPFIVSWWKRNAPEVLRGQLACEPKKYGSKMGKPAGFLLGNVLLNSVSRPNFIAYGLCEKKPVTVKLSEKLGAMKVLWTSHSRENEEKNDTVIFEYYRPEPSFK